MTMLRRVGEGVELIDHASKIKITICKVYGNRVKVGIEAPKTLDVQLHETYQRIQADLQQKIESYYCKEQEKKQAKNLTPKNSEKKAALEKLRILLVEDVEIIRKANCSFIKTLGCMVDVAEDGRKAIDMLHNPYDLVLLDIGLPDITGLEVCKWLRTNPTNANIPVIFLTAFGEGMRAKCNEVGGSDFAVKPLSMEKLLKLVKQWLPLKQKG